MVGAVANTMIPVELGVLINHLNVNMEGNDMSEYIEAMKGPVKSLVALYLLQVGSIVCILQ